MINRDTHRLPTGQTSMHYDEILYFWFEETDHSLWWQKNESFDQHITERFRGVHSQAIRCELYPWRQEAGGRLAEIIVLDQFSRNMFRDSTQSFAHDALALALAQEAVSIGADQLLTPEQRSFLYMPFMHSESLAIHEQAVSLFERLGNKANLEFELKHKHIIERFGRYPHRNNILGRSSTPEELEFLTQPGSSF